MELEARLFGKVVICCHGHNVEHLPAKAQELFLFLLLYRDRPHTRETVAARLWTDATEKQSKKYLRQTLWQLQSALESRAPSRKAAVFDLNSGWIHICPDAGLWLDIDVFEQAYSGCRDIAGRDLNARQAQVLAEATGLYKGDLLETWYEDWCLDERDRLQSIYLAMLDKLMGYCETHRQYEEGLAYGNSILRYDRAREPTYRRLMRLHYLAGNRTAALRQFGRCESAMERELSVRPGNATISLYEQIRADQLDGLRQTPGNDTKPRDETDPLSEVLMRLERMESSISALKDQVRQDLAAIERTLDPEH